MQKEPSYVQIAITFANIAANNQEPSVDLAYKILNGAVSKKKLTSFLKTWKERQESPDFSDIPLSSQDISNNEDIDTTTITEKDIAELEHSLSLVRATLNSTTDGILFINNEGKLVDWNQQFVKLLGIPDSVLRTRDEGEGVRQVMAQLEDPDELMMLMKKTYEHPEMSGYNGEMRFKDGRIIDRYSQPHRIGNKQLGRVWSFRDVTEKKKAEEILRLRERAIDASTNGIFILDVDTKKIIYNNPAFEKITGYAGKQIDKAGFEGIFFSVDKETSAHQRIKATIDDKRDQVNVLRCKNKKGKSYWCELHIAAVPDADNEISHFLGIINDVTERRKMEEQLTHQATHDQLTDLPNRSLLLDRIEQSILRAKRQKTMVAIIFIDLDNFKFVNDSLSHGAGDIVINEIGKRLAKCTRLDDTIARVGGDEFIMVSGIKQESEILPLTNRILQEIRKPIEINKSTINITTSVGVSFYPKDGKDVATLMKHADISMYNAKKSGRDTFSLYDRNSHEVLLKRIDIENHLRTALEKNEFHLVYQPIIDLRTNNIISVEALLRWENAVLGKVSPVDFIPVAEDSGLISEIGNWVITEAAEQGAKWMEKGLEPKKIAINLSTRQFMREDFPVKLKALIDAANYTPEKIELELTESMLIEHAEKNLVQLWKLKEMGFSLSIDDFGTGYSSLSYLKQLPVDKLKIDQSFINNILTNTSNAEITLAIIKLAHALKLDVLAEGVEEKEQRDLLIEYQCDEAQGYYFSKPILPAEYEKLLDKKKK